MLSHLDPRIGALNSGKFYAFLDGYDKPEFTGTLAEVEAALGLRAGPPVSPRPSPSAAHPIGALRTYVVTVTPSTLSYAGGWVGAEYQVEVTARSRALAISAAREQRRAEDGRHVVPATFRARLAPLSH